MTRKSRRELERDVAELVDDGPAGSFEITLHDTVVGTGWSGPDSAEDVEETEYMDLDPGEEVEETEVFEL